MSIEFGILREGFTNTLVGESRVLLDHENEELLLELAPLFKRIELRSGENLGEYGSATFSGEALNVLMEELQGALAAENKAKPTAHAFVTELLRVAQFAKGTGQCLSYFGL